MILTQRERYIACGAGGLLAVMLVQFVIIGPYFDRRDAIQTDLQNTIDDIEKVELLKLQHAKARKVWNQMIAGGLGSSATLADTMLQTALAQWAQDSGMSISALHPQSASPDGKFIQISYHLSGAGPLSTVSRLLWRLETTALPLRITGLQLSPRKEGYDDLQMQIEVSTICRVQDSDSPDKSRRGGGVASATYRLGDHS